MLVDYKDLGQRIRKKREKCGMSQAELATKAQLSTQHVSNVENARSKISLEKLLVISNVLNCSLDELVCGSMRNSRLVYNSEIAEIIEDFSDTELRILPDFLRHYNYAYKILKLGVDEESDF